MNITPRHVLSTVQELGGAYLGKYILQDGTKTPALGILGMRDTRVKETEGVEVLVCPVPEGNFAYMAGTHSMEHGYFRVHIIQHRSHVVYLPKIVEVCSSFVHFGEIKYFEESAKRMVPYAEMTLGFSSLHLTNSLTYDAFCSFNSSCPIG